MTTPSPMPYVKFWTKIISSPQWRSTPPNHRFVFMHLIVLAGANGSPGFVTGSDRAIASMLGCTRGVVERAINRFTSEPKPSLSRTDSGVKILNWGLYQAIPEDTRQDVEKIKTKTLRDVLKDREWWAARVAEHPNLDLITELEKAGEWHKIETVKNHKTFFRNWLTKASASAPARVVDRTPDEIRASLRVVS